MISSGRSWMPLLMAIAFLPATVEAQTVHQLPSQMPGAASPTRNEPRGLRDSPDRTIMGGLLARVATMHELDRRMRWEPILKSGYARQQNAARKRGWIARHPVLFGALAGFGTGFLIGYAAGDDGVFYDFTAGFNGVLLGGIGAGAGAAVGAIAEALAD